MINTIQALISTGLIGMVIPYISPHYPSRLGLKTTLFTNPCKVKERICLKTDLNLCPLNTQSFFEEVEVTVALQLILK